MFEDQLKALEKFSELKVAALFMEMGTGKTRTALELARNAKGITEVLWLGPKSTLKNVQQEISKYEPLNVPISFLGYETLASSDKTYLELLNRLENENPVLFLVCDESLFLKNGRTKRWQRVNQIRTKFAEYVVLLNGTPVSRDEMDLFWQMEILSPQIIGMTEPEFRRTMFTKFVNNITHQVWYKSCHKNVAWLKSRIAPYVFECDLNIPVHLIHHNESVDVSMDTRESYSSEKRELLRSIRNWDDILIIKSLSRMKMIGALDDNKILKTVELIRKLEKPLVFCEYLEEQDSLFNKLDRCLIINSSINQLDRNLIIRRWENENLPLLITFGCGAFGLNLQATNSLVMSSLPWNYSTYSQALHRAFRIGQTKDVAVYKFEPRLGISKIVDECLWKKITLAELIKTTDWESML